ncbi:MAG: hypothetical protein AB7O57_15545 [Hyphomicrobiaceae bacterium]
MPVVRKIIPERRDPRRITPTIWTPLSETTGIPVATTLGIEVAQSVAREILTGVDTRGWGWLEAEYDRLWASKETTIHGGRKYALVEQTLEQLAPWRAGEPASLEPGLELVRQARREAPRSIFLAALLAHLLRSAAHAWKASTRSAGERRERTTALSSEAEAVLAEAAARGADGPFWHRMLCRSALVDGSDRAEKERRYRRAVAFDPADVFIHLARGHQLMPDWHGSFAEIERHAREAAEVSSATMGAAMYAQVYNLVSLSHPLGSTSVDWARLWPAHEDSMRAFPSQPDANIYARLAHEQREKAVVRRAFESHLAVYFQRLWRDDGQFLKAFRSTGLAPRTMH